MVDLASMLSEEKAGRLWVLRLERRLGGVRDRVGISYIGFTFGYLLVKQHVERKLSREC
jgi:hypothetical protein